MLWLGWVAVGCALAPAALPVSRAPSRREEALAARVGVGLVLVGPGGAAAETVQELGRLAAAALGTSLKCATGADCVKKCGGRDVVYVDDALLKKNRGLRRAVSKQRGAVWARCVGADGADLPLEAERPKLRDLTRYDVAVALGDADYGGGAAEVLRLGAFASRPRCTAEETALDMGADTFFVSLTFDNFEDLDAPLLVPGAPLKPKPKRAGSGWPTGASPPAPLVAADGEASKRRVIEGIAADGAVAALEFRVDLLKDWAVGPGAVLRALSQLRTTAAATTWEAGGESTIVYTVRSKTQAGTFPADGEAMASLLEVGVRAGVDWLDVEARSLGRGDRKKLRALTLDRGDTRVLGSHHAVGARSSRDAARKMIADTRKRTKCDAVKVVADAATCNDALAVAGLSDANTVVLCLGEAGKASRVLNCHFTPATHELLPVAAAPGQLSPKETMELRQALGVTRKLDFFILMESDFGSKSPAMHNAAFNAARLPHVYTVQELPLKGGLDDVKSEAATQLRTRLSAPDFGGASVTIPHKQAIVPFLDELTPAARAIGAVNTIVPVPMPDDPQMRHKLLGDNTDWLGLSITLARALAKREVNGVPQRRRRALVVGGGGTARAACYALTAGAMKPGPLGAPFVLYVHARDPAQAKDLAKAFGGHVITDLDAFALTIQDDFFDAVVSTVPGGAKFTLPRKLLACKPAVMDAAYKPAETALLQQARVSGCSVAQGATMLVEQGVSQFERWTRRRAPTDCMRTAVFEGVPNLEDPQADKACAPSPAPAELVVL